VERMFTLLFCGWNRTRSCQSK